MESALDLLTRDGAIHVAFRPRLTADQYAELMKVVAEPATKAALRKALEEAAERWDRRIEVAE